MQPRVKRKRLTGDRVHSKRKVDAMEEWSEIKEDEVDVYVKKKAKVMMYSACILWCVQF